MKNWIEKYINRRVKEEVSKEMDKEESGKRESKNQGRREFMKSMGLGAAGLGAAAMAPNVSGFEIRSENPLEYYRQGESSPAFRSDAGGNVSVSSIEADSISENRVYDTAGRQHGELTGSNDAQVVIDAINDRQGQEGIIIPDTGFELEWEQEVRLPRAENGFTLETKGMPKIVPTSDFSGEAVIKKPTAEDAGNKDIQGYNIGSFFIDDRPNEVLNWGMILDDLKGSYIAPSHFFGCPGIHLPASNFWTNQNMIDKPNVISERGPGVRLSANPFDDYNRGADQNWVRCPHFNQTPWAEDDQTAFIDEGRGNTWAFTRCEFAGTVHKQRHARRYTIIEGQWDRDDKYNLTVDERDKFTYGKVWTRNYAGYKKANIINPSTQVFNAGRTGRKISPVDFGKATLSRSIQDIGFAQNSTSGGTVSIENKGYSGPVISMQTEASSGEIAEVDLGGGNAYGSGVCPKLYLTTRMVESVSDIVFRAGIYRNDTEYGEIIYDPGNSLEGTDFGQNWGLRVKTDGNIRDETDMGLGPTAGESQTISIQRLLSAGKGDPDADFYGTVIDSDNLSYTGRASNNGTRMARCNVRIRIENTSSESNEVYLVPNRKLTLWSRTS